MRNFIKFVVVVALAALIGGGVYLYVAQNHSAGAPPATNQPNAVVASPENAKQSELIPQASPVWIAIPGVLDRTAMNPQGIVPVGGVVNPVDNRPVFRTDSNQPGTNSPGVALIYGHNYIDPDDYVPFAALESVEVSDTIQVGTANGVLSYSVRQTFTVPKSELASRQDIFENVPNRLVLITCDTKDGRDTYDNRIVIADLAT